MARLFSRASQVGTVILIATALVGCSDVCEGRLSGPVSQVAMIQLNAEPEAVIIEGQHLECWHHLGTFEELRFHTDTDLPRVPTSIGTGVGGATCLSGELELRDGLDAGPTTIALTLVVEGANIEGSAAFEWTESRPSSDFVCGWTAVTATAEFIAD
ncbi:MAG: hypothetical protein ACJAYU_000098 [Bradymonadia bacterium]